MRQTWTTEVLTFKDTLAPVLQPSPADGEAGSPMQGPRLGDSPKRS